MARIIVVDEDVDWLVGMRSFLERNGHQTTLAASYREGFELIEVVRPDLIFIDLDPGDLNGILLYRKVKQHGELSQIPVIITSYHEEARSLYRPYGDTAFLKKPFKLSRLIKTLGVYL